MNKLALIVPAATALIASSVMLTPTPAKAFPTCEQEVRIRCSGYSVQGHGRLDIYYDSFEECVEQETFFQCGGPYPSNAPADNVDKFYDMSAVLRPANG